MSVSTTQEYDTYPFARWDCAPDQTYGFASLDVTWWSIRARKIEHAPHPFGTVLLRLGWFTVAPYTCFREGAVLSVGIAIVNMNVKVFQMRLA